MLLLKDLPSIQASARQLRLIRFQMAPPVALRVDMAENSMIETDKTIFLYGSSDSGVDSVKPKTSNTRQCKDQ